MNVFKTTFLLASLTALLGLFGMIIDSFLKTNGLVTIIMLGIGIATNWYSYFFSDKVVLKMYKARVVSEAEAPELYSIVQNLCQRINIPMPKICIIPTDVPNAFATGRNPNNAAVACTEGIMRALNRDELEGVIAHELGHVKNRDTLTSTVAASIAGAIGIMSTAAQYGSMMGMGRRDENGGGNPIILILFAIAAPFIAMLIQMTISRTREYSADRAAAEMTHNPDALANALRKIESFANNYQMPATQGTQHMFIINPFSGAKMREWFSTHPPTAKRIAALEIIKAELATGRA